MSNNGMGLFVLCNRQKVKEYGKISIVIIKEGFECRKLYVFIIPRKKTAGSATGICQGLLLMASLFHRWNSI